MSDVKRRLNYQAWFFLGMGATLGLTALTPVVPWWLYWAIAFVVIWTAMFLSDRQRRKEKDHSHE